MATQEAGFESQPTASSDSVDCSIESHASKLVKQLAELFGEDTHGVLPLVLPPRPVKPASPSARLRQRWSGRLKIWKVAFKLVSAINALNSGSFSSSHRTALLGHRAPRVQQIQQFILGKLFAEATLFAKGRRGLDPSGDQPPLVQLVKAAREVEGYVRAVRAPPQVPLTTIMWSACWTRCRLRKPCSML